VVAANCLTRRQREKKGKKKGREKKHFSHRSIEKENWGGGGGFMKRKRAEIERLL